MPPKHAPPAATITLANTLLMTTTQLALVGSALLVTLCAGTYEAACVANLKQQLGQVHYCVCTL